MLAIGAFVLAGCKSNTVMIAMDDNFTQFREVPKLDPNVHKDKVKSITAGVSFKLVGPVSATPQLTFTTGYQAHWNDTQQELIRRYEELVNAFNSGIISMPEYNRQLAKLNNYEAETKQLAMEQREYMRNVAQIAFAELEAETTKTQIKEFAGKKQYLENRISSINSQLKSMPAPRTKKGS